MKKKEYEVLLYEHNQSYHRVLVSAFNRILALLEAVQKLPAKNKYHHAEVTLFHDPNHNYPKK